MVSQAQRGANAWLATLPVDQHLSIPSPTFRWNLRHWLGSEQAWAEEHKLPCQCQTTEQAHHTVRMALPREHHNTCKVGGGMIKRHDLVVRTVAEMVRQTETVVTVEPRAILPGFGNGGPDLLLEIYQRTLVDVSVVCQSQPTLATQAAEKPLHAANSAAAAKVTKYGDKCSAIGARFVPAILETAGAFGPSLIALIEELARVYSHKHDRFPCSIWSSNTFSRYWTQRIAVTLRHGAFVMADMLKQRGNIEHYKRKATRAGDSRHGQEGRDRRFPV